MRQFKKKFAVLFAALSVAVLFACGGLTASAQVSEVYIGGMPAGFTLNMGGAQVIGMCEVLTAEGVTCPAREADVGIGDVIVRFNGVSIRSATDVDGALAASGGKTSEIVVKNGSESETKQITPAKDMASGKYKLGVLIRDSVSGIGTVTYIEPMTRRFGSLGHAVSGEDGTAMALAQGGTMYACSIVNVVRGERGKAGELKGIFVGEKSIASAEKNCQAGIFGTFNGDYDLSSMRLMPVGSDAHPGAATIYTTIAGLAPQEYSIEIVKVDSGSAKNKNFVIKVTDKKLLAETGGIVQGMSGSPIVQDGALVGAVTHVFLNDPTRGYGIAIENMLNH